jgi:hypothetical protein
MGILAGDFGLEARDADGFVFERLRRDDFAVVTISSV